jgi:outer membrane protein assembly factor BamE (lipoprotein component of BamABCDE complex)
MSSSDQKKQSTDLSSSRQQRKEKPEAQNGASTQSTQSIDISSWRQLKKGMSEEQVRVLLGEPSKIDGGTVSQWHYKSNGSVTFLDDKLFSWSEPR